MAYTGAHAEKRACDYCGAPRFREELKVNPYQQFLYIPLAKRLEIQFSNRDRSCLLKAYRTELLKSYTEGQYRDIWDGRLFHEYHRQKLGLFKNPTDVGLQLSLDGVQMVRKKTHSVTPVILLNLNLPPEERVQIQNILISTLIPGPAEPKDLDSFLYPLVQEMHILGDGIDGVVDGEFGVGTAGHIFRLRAWITTVTGDGPAAAKAMGFKRPGAALSPCRMCYIKGRRMPGSSIHYVPHDGKYSGFDMRTEARTDINLAVQANDEATYTQWGITRKSILTGLRSIHFPRSFPIDIMHCILLNIVPSLFRLWIGKVKGIDEDTNPEYRLSTQTLERIGAELEDAASCIPTSLGHVPRRVERHYNGFKAAEWKAWLTLYGIPCLVNRLPDAHLHNFVVLSEIFTLATKWQLSERDVDRIGELSSFFLQSYETLYYRGIPGRLRLCTVNFHYLAHLRQHILDAGPACYWWQFPMERYCGTIVPMARSKSRLSQSLMNSLITTEHLNHYNFIIPTNAPKKNPPPLPHLTTPISRPATERSKTNHPRWLSEIHRKYERPGVDLEPPLVEFFLKCQLTTSVSVGCTTQTKRVNGRANFIVCYYDEQSGWNRFGEVKIYALVNGTDAWAHIEHLAPTPPTIDFRQRTCWYPKRSGRLLWAPISCIRAAAGIITCSGRRYCVTDLDIYSR